jgi:hypothetical protein
LFDLPHKCSHPNRQPPIEVDKEAKGRRPWILDLKIGKFRIGIPHSQRGYSAFSMNEKLKLPVDHPRDHLGCR